MWLRNVDENINMEIWLKNYKKADWILKHIIFKFHIVHLFLIFIHELVNKYILLSYIQSIWDLNISGIDNV
jgi:hypothetical protein